VGVAMEITENAPINILPEAIRSDRVVLPQATAQVSSEVVNKVALEKGHAPSKEERLSEEERKELVKKTITEMNAEFELKNYSIRFSIDDKLKEIVVKIVDTKTDEVIRQIPPDEVLRLRAHLKEMVGILLEEKT
jgi:flagellar protein FlaG